MAHKIYLYHVLWKLKIVEIFCFLLVICHWVNFHHKYEDVKREMPHWRRWWKKMLPCLNPKKSTKTFRFNWSFCLFAWKSCAPKAKLDFCRDRVLIPSQVEWRGIFLLKKGKLNSVIIVPLPFSTQVSTQSLTVDSSETYFCKEKKRNIYQARNVTHIFIINNEI
jgi:hypothetical protein